MTNINATVGDFTHGFHPYPAKFPPAMVQKFLNTYCRRGDTLLDPFCGSGTALVAGALCGINAVGIDLNPIACLASRAKTHHYDADELHSAKDFAASIRHMAVTPAAASAPTAALPDYPNRAHWFQENVSRELSYLKHRIGEVRQEKLRDLLACAFSKIIVKVSNQDSEVRYTAKAKNHPDGFVFSSYAATLDGYLKIIGNAKQRIAADAAVHHGDTAEVLTQFADNHFHFVITSPPYINTFDYYLYHKQRMFWLDFDHRPVRSGEIGNHHRIDRQSMQESEAEYIASMTRIVRQVSRVSKPGAYFIMIVGDGIVKGKILDMSKIAADLCQKANYQIVQIDSIGLADITKSFNKKFSRGKKREHTIIMRNIK